MDWEKVLVEVDKALKYFESQRVKPTLRTLFYYLFSKGVIPGTRSAYKCLSTQLVKARKQGRYNWDFLEDKTRVVLGMLMDNRFSDTALDNLTEDLQWKLESLDIEELIDEYFSGLLPWVSVGKWAEQPVVCEVWIEKEALASTLQSWISDMEVPIRVNRGYSSWTFIYNNVQSLMETLRKHNKVVIFYLGDLDPSGVDIERFLRDAIEFFGLNSEQVSLRRLAVTAEQVDKFNLPPRPEDLETLSKLKRDPRMKGYTNDYIVELDALVAYAPASFQRIVREAIDNVWNKSIHDELVERAHGIQSEGNRLIEEAKQRAKEKILNELG